MFIGIQLLVGVAVGVAAVVLKASGTDLDQSQIMIVGIAVGEAVACAATLALGAVLARAPMSEIVPLRAFSPLVVVPIVVAAVGLSIVVSELDNLLRAVMPMPAFLAEMLQDLGRGGLAAMIAVVVVAPLTEEALFRGLILRGLAARYGGFMGVVISAVLFAVMHINPYQFGAGLVTGFFLGWLFLRTGSLWPCILLHAAFNGHLMLLPWLRDLGLHVPGYTADPDLGAAVEFQPPWFDALGAGLIVLAAIGVALLTRRKAGE
jgi:membrane protease YdiL (CAAX protease family)